MTLQVIVIDTVTGKQSDVHDVPLDGCVVVTGPNAYVSHHKRYRSGTEQYTIKRGNPERGPERQK